jgi:hypothetical protein
MIIGYLSDLDEWRTTKVNLTYPKMEKLVTAILSSGKNENINHCKDITRENLDLAHLADLMLIAVGFEKRKVSLLIFDGEQRISIEIVRWFRNTITTIYLQSNGTYSEVADRARRELTVKIL